MFRKTLTPGDPLRDWTLIWSLDAVNGTGQPLGAWATLSPLAGGQAIQVPPQSVEKPPQLTNCVQVVRIPETLPAGDYAVTVNGVGYGTITVTPPRPKRDVAYLSPSIDADTLERELAVRDVILNPGAYHFARAIHLPPGSYLEGYGADIIRESDGDYGERLFVGGQDCTIRGLTLRPLYLAFHANPAVTGLVLQDVTIRSGILGYGPTAMLIVDCLFDGGYVTFGPPGLYLRCRWVGSRVGSHALMFASECVRCVALVDCEMDGTDRGPVFNTDNGPVTDNLIVNLRCSHIAGADNGNEIVLAEGTHEFSRNLILFVYLHDCLSNVYQLDAPSHDNFLFGLMSDGPCWVRWSGWGGVEVTGNVLANFELRGGRVMIGCVDANGTVVSGGVRGNTLRDGAFVGQILPSRLNQPFYRPEFYQPSGWIVAPSPTEAAANYAINVECPAIPGVTDQLGGITRTAVRITGTSLARETA